MSLRPATEGIAHGGRLAEARRRFPGAPEPFLDLSTGINPLPYTLPPMAPDWFTRLPEPEAFAGLQAVAARAYGVADPAMVVAAPGTQILISLLPRLFGLGRVAVLAPTYAEHAAAWRSAGQAVTETGTLAGLAEAAVAVAVAVLCNPNNPDGRRFAPDELLGLADRLAARGGLLLVDEAFADLEPEGLSVAPALPHPALIVLRSFGKTYGLAGIRLGFALAAPERASAIRAALGPWAVSGPAIAIGARALADGAWRAQAARSLAEGAVRLDAALIGAGLRVVGGTRLFRLAESPDAAARFRQLGARGIFVRHFAAHPTWLRFGQPADGPAWDRLERALAEPLLRPAPAAPGC